MGDGAQKRTTLWILGDQLWHDHPALAGGPAAASHVLLIESEACLGRRPYQPQKLALLLSAMRHFAEELRGRSYDVDYRRAPTFSAGLRAHLADHRPDELVTMAASGYRGRAFQGRLSEALGLPVEVLPNTQFLTGRHNPIPRPQPGKRVVMENFYRAMRRHFGLLMDGDEPAGGRWNFDEENRKPLPRDAVLPADVVFEPDAITRSALAEVGLSPERWAGYAVDREQALVALRRFINERLPHFGAYEDAMTGRSHSLYHSMLSPYLNLGLLEPLEVAAAAAAAWRAGTAPLNSVEGFIRQIIGWREYMYWQYWRQMPGMETQNAWGATRPLPGFFWSGETPMACLRHALGRALTTGYNHHIERLMLLSNFMMLAGVDPAAANDWFLAVYVDAYEWVMPGNVIGMGLNADGGLTATKPYIASAAYINRMSDHCRGCPFDPKARTGDKACPFNALYWDFLVRHEARLRANPRFGPAVLGLSRLDATERAAVGEQAARFLDSLD